MQRKTWWKGVLLGAELLGFWLGMRVLFPIFLPFLLGFCLAAASERGVRFLHVRLRLPRPAASALGVSVTLVLAAGALGLAASLGYRELSALAKNLPDLAGEFSGQVETLRDWLLAQAGRLPPGLDRRAARMISELFAGGSVLMERLTSGVLRLAGVFLGGIPGGALLTATAVISGYLISGQLPQLQEKFCTGRFWRQRLEPALQNIHRTLAAWFKAQVKLSGITFCIVAMGLVLLKIRYAAVWAVGIAVVDAVPMLGTGTVLIPWAVWSLLEGNGVKALGLAGIYAAAMVTRSALEPRLVGRHLGLNPLVTLLALYGGYRIWGVAGMVLSPIFTVTAVQLLHLQTGDGKL